MSRVNPRILDSKVKMKYLDLLWTSIAQLETKEEVKKFFKDLLSESEAIMLARRIEIAKRLIDGQSYDEIAGDLKVGTDTISRVQQWLISGFGGYEKAIDGFNKELGNRIGRIKNINEEIPYSFTWIKKKYPLHFLLFNLLSGDSHASKRAKR
ncbi:MAG: YerC/YecD family TrpR-related protein [Candidatus Paceibacterota bacterium]|jgi:TrpR-related protein YerC/YecD